jgi:hypothetical protein
MPITIADLRKLEKNALTAGVMDIFLMEHELAQYVPVKKVNTMKARVIREVSLPTPGWRQFSQGFAESKGSIDWAEETIYSIGGYIDVDELIEMDANVIESPRSKQIKLWAKALAYAFNDVVVNGNAGVNPDQPDGVVVRVANLAARQIIAGGSLDITNAGAATNANAFLDLLDSAIYACDGHRADALLMNDQMLLAIWRVLRNAKLLDITRDQFGREIVEYKGAKLIDVGVKADQTTRIIPTTANNSSIYAVKFGEEYFSMLNYRPLKVTDIGRLESKPTLRTEVEWAFGFMMPHPRGLAVLNAIKVT